MKYYTRLDGPRPGEFQLLLHTADGRLMYCQGAPVPPWLTPDEKTRYRHRQGREAAHLLWKDVRHASPESFAEAVELGWIDAPRDCPECHGHGSTVDRVVDRFAQALQVGMYDRITGEGPRTPTMLARLTCATCNGRGWA